VAAIINGIGINGNGVINNENGGVIINNNNINVEKLASAENSNGVISNNVNGAGNNGM
jgi:hypothetical protein